MLTFFTIPKPFEGIIGTAQKNSIRSWLTIHPGSEAIVFGNEKGAVEAASELGFRHVKDIRRNRFGTPLVSEAFHVAHNISKYGHLVFMNTDIILLNNLLEAAKSIQYPNYLMVGRRTDLDFKEEIDFVNPDWKKALIHRAMKNGKLHGFSGIDYFLFPKSLAPEMPPFRLAAPAGTVGSSTTFAPARSLSLTPPRLWAPFTKIIPGHGVRLILKAQRAPRLPADWLICQQSVMQILSSPLTA